MAIPAVGFSREGYKIIKVFWLKINCSQIKSLNFVNWSYGEVAKSAEVGRSNSIFYIKNHSNLYDFFFIEEYEFRSIFFVIDIF